MTAAAERPSTGLPACTAGGPTALAPPAHLPLTPDGLPDLVAMRAGGLARQADETERRLRMVAEAGARLAGAGRGSRAVAWRQVADLYSVSVSTLRRHCRARAEGGAAALVPAWGSTRGTARAIPEKLGLQILDAWAYGGRLTVAQIRRHIAIPFCRDAGQGTPDIRTVARYIERECPPLVAGIAREGKRFHQERHEPKVRRSLESAGVNGWWVSDHRLGDTMVMVPDGKGTGWPGKSARYECTCGSGRERRECCSVRRVWWTVTVDAGTAAFVGWRFSMQPNAATVAHQVRQAILDFGLPSHWLRDNGKEFTARSMNGPALRMGDPTQADLAGRERWPALLPRQCEQSTIWDQLGVAVVTAIPYSSWSKPIEPVFGAFSRRYENLLPGWTGNSPKRRPEKLTAELMDGELLTLAEYIGAIERQIAEWNALSAHGERAMAPLAYYEGHAARRPAPETLAFLLQATTQKTIHQGRIEIGGHIYQSPALAIMSGQRVSVRHDPGAPEAVYVYAADGGACLAVPEVPRAKWGEWGEANRLARGAAREQRAFVREWAAKIKGACPPERLDPYGAHAAVADRIRTMPVPAADAAAEAQAAARIDAKDAAGALPQRGRSAIARARERRAQ